MISKIKRKIIVGIVLLCIILIMTINATANIEIIDTFSDFTSSDVTIKSNENFGGKAVFELLYEGKVVESQTVPLQIKEGGTISKVVIWNKRPQHDYYTSRVSIYNGDRLLDNRSYQVSYGTIAMPSFHVVDFSPTNRDVQLLLNPFKPSVVDVKIELLDSNSIIYTETKEDISLTTDNELKIGWPFLLKRDNKYTVRAKIFSHRLYADPLINTYIADFIANDDVEILQDDVEVDEYGASVTLRGESQVPFDGAIIVTARNRVTNDTKTYRQQVEEILVTGKEDTAGVVWKGLSSGTYDIEIQAINDLDIKQGTYKILDKYETVLRIPEEQKAGETPIVQSTPGFTTSISMISIIAVIFLIAIRRKRGG